LEFVREAGECREPDTTSLVTGADPERRRRGCQVFRVSSLSLSV
jgi:hypothetical protein